MRRPTSCLRHDSFEDYLKELETMSDEELEIEYRKNCLLCNEIRYKYNYIKSCVYVNFLQELKTYVSNDERLHKSLINYIYCCDSAFVSLVIFEHYHLPLKDDGGTSHDRDNYLRTIKRLFKDIKFYYDNIYLMTINSKNACEYLLKKLFNETFEPEDKIITYEAEIDFVDRYMLEKYESEELDIDVDDCPKKDIVDAVYYYILLDVEYLDRSMSELYKNR